MQRGWYMIAFHSRGSNRGVKSASSGSSDSCVGRVLSYFVIFDIGMVLAVVIMWTCLFCVYRLGSIEFSRKFTILSEYKDGRGKNLKLNVEA